jgi:hypothetical protein
MNYCLLAFSKLCYKVLSFEIIEFDLPTRKQLVFLGKQGSKLSHQAMFPNIVPFKILMI